MHVDLTQLDALAAGDASFKGQLLEALLSALEELRQHYAQGAEAQDAEQIRLIRHKLKPTVEMFGVRSLQQLLQEGKELYEQEGFGLAFRLHAEKLVQESQAVTVEVEGLIQRFQEES
ncbi:hypothetical protein A3SI_09637 [Nitritalea halalkaliphila LW7]|uniref:HPt domain-containing protein n=1 Tax=Nitritalea halalkaliphila LW7 TaxID=1189621 RepID=I5C3Q1_9BACT|nr:hypothetical protein [Nitritalea halalkaliphila]EIM76453.1 hypothetical protein A3SI_09637 [Nitritalea halalkaliphila LW7]